MLKFNLIQQNKFKPVFIIILLSSLSILLLNYLAIGILLCLILFIYLIYQEDSILFFSIMLFLVFIGEEIGPSFRLIFQLMGISLMLFLFFKQYGMNFPQFPKIPRPFVLLLSLLFASIIISALFSKYPGAAIGPILRLTAFLLIAYLFYSQINNFHSVKIILISLFVVSTIMAAAVFYDFIVNGFSLINLLTASYRASGIISNYNATAGFFAITTPLTFSLLLSDIKRSHKVYLGFFLFVQLLALLSTGSRSAYLAITIAFLIILFNLNRNLFKKIIFTSFALIIIPILIEPLRNFFMVLFRFERGITSRDELWAISFNMIKDNFLFGIGPGAYKQEMFNYFPVMINSFQGNLLTVLFENTQGRNVSHNFYLTLFSDLGVLGFLFSVLFPLVIFKLLKKIITKLKKSITVEYFIVIGIVGSISGMFIRGFFEGISIMSYGSIYVDLPLWLLLSITLFYYRELSKFQSPIL